MPKVKRYKKAKQHKSFIRNVHLQAVVVLIIYLVFSKSILVYSVVNKNIFASFLIPFLYGSVAAVTFLYLYSHEDFFHFMKEVETIEKKKEKGYIEKFIHFGKVLSIFIIGVIAGPLFSSLSARILVNKKSYKYLLVVLANIPATLMHIGISKGIFNFII